jgi:hypothetical protein
MHWDNIRIFLSVARAGQFSAAALQLRIDNGTVGRRINALEKSLGVRLFDSKRSVAAQVLEFCTIMQLAAMSGWRSFRPARCLNAAIGSLPIWTCASSVEFVQFPNLYLRK